MVNASDLLIEPPQNATSIKDLAIYTNNVTQGLYGIGILLVVFAVAYLFMAQKSRPVNSLIAALFTTTITSYFLFVIQILGGEVPIALTLGIISLSTIRYLDQQAH